MALRVLSCLSILSVLVGCASTYQPKVDMTGIDAERYNQDIALCTAKARNAYAGGPILVGLLAGAALGAGAGAVIGNSGGIAMGWGALAGGVTGAATGAIIGPVEGPNQKAVLQDCLIRQGYKLLPDDEK